MIRPPPPSYLCPYTTLFLSLSPSRIVTTRRGIGSRRRNAVAAATSGGETTAPSANADAHGRPGIALCATQDRKSTRLNSSHQIISYAVLCLKKKKIIKVYYH